MTQSNVARLAGRVDEGGVAQRVAAHDLEVLDAVEEQVHPRDGGGGEVLLLAEDLSPEKLRRGPRLLPRRAGRRSMQHAAGAAGGVVDGLALLRVEDVDQHPDDRTRGVELARLLVREVGELLDQVLVGVAEHVGADGGVAERDLGEVLDRVLSSSSGSRSLLVHLRVAEDAVERVWVRLLDRAHALRESRADVAGASRTSMPVAALGRRKRWTLGEVDGGGIAESSAAAAVSSSQTSQMRLKNSSGRM